MRAHVPCCAPRPRRSMCWYLRGLSTPTGLPYSSNTSEPERDMTAIEIYTRPGCGYCTAAKSLLTRKNAAFTELNVANDPAYREQMYDRAGAGTTFPQIFIGPTHVGGCDELYALDRAGKLDGLLASDSAGT